MKKIILVISILLVIVIFLLFYSVKKEYTGLIEILEVQNNDTDYFLTFQIIDWEETITVEIDSNFVFIDENSNRVSFNRGWDSIKVNEYYHADVIKENGLKSLNGEKYTLEKMYLLENN
ncbi:hypothetical protein [Oceanobacillus sojae]|uniref:hypothetical protein n=1 Tax=Oceanobacillus sojae TaxID=582851 RepID=UPI0009888338|nr:hypothetical protein [Oceanobacillus sojae]